MAIVVNAPKFSFIRFGNQQFLEEKSCQGESVMQLPVLMESSELIFQLIFTGQSNELLQYEPELYIRPGVLTDSSEYDNSGQLVTTGLKYRYAINPSDVVWYFSQLELISFVNIIKPDSCFQLWLKIGNTFHPSTRFKRITDPCHTTVITYRCDEDAFGFYYCEDEFFYNRVRLPVMLMRPQLPDEEVVYQRSDGRRKMLSSVTSKVYRMVTDWQNTRFHECLKMALSHDEVLIENDIYNGEMVKTGSYDLEWPEFHNIDLGRATVELTATPYHAKNANCQDCNEKFQMFLENDHFEQTLEGNQNYTINVAANDIVYCLPHTYSIFSTNSLFVDSATITPIGQLSITLKSNVPPGTNVALVTYKVTCANGQYKTAIVTGNVEVEEPQCENPQNVIANSLAPETMFVQWDEVPGAASYLVRITNISTNMFQEFVGTSPLVVSVPAGEYEVQVFTNCGSEFSIGTDPIIVQVQPITGGGGGPQSCYCFDLPTVYTVPIGGLCNDGSAPSC